MANDPAADWLREGGVGRAITAALMAFAGGLVQHFHSAGR